MGQPATVEELSVVELLSALPVDSLQELADSATIRNLGPAEVVFNEGDEGTSLFVVRKGMVKIVRADEPGAALVTLGPGKVFGELAVLDPAPRSATAITIDSSELIELDGKSLEEVVDSKPGVARKMLGAMARSLTMARERVVQHNRVLDETVQERTQELRETQLEVIRRLGRAAEFRDDDTGLHITRMSRFCARLAKAAGFTDSECDLLLHAAPMHDIGKIGIPDRILLKPGKLEPEEFEIMKTHTLIGGELLEGSTSAVMQMAQVIALNHHEKWNGKGYPNGKSGEDIPFVARICSVCDVFDALISSRPYKKAWTVDEALNLIEEQAGNDFDPHLAQLFLKIRHEIEELLANQDALLAATPGTQEAGEIAAYEEHASQPTA